MDSQQIEKILSTVPAKERQRISEDRVRQIAPTLPDDIRILAYAITMPARLESRSQVRSGTALVTSTRLVFLEPEGRVFSLNYADIEHLDVRGGTKKLIGGYNRAELWITSRGGEVQEWSMGAGGEWGSQAAKAAQHAHSEYLLAHGR